MADDLSCARPASGRGILAPIAVMVAVTIPFLPYFLGDCTSHIPRFEDDAQWSIYARFLSESYGRGSLPLWIHSIYSGFPFYAWAHASMFYPPAALFYWFDFASGVWIDQWLHCLIFSLGLYGLGLRARASRGSAAVAAVFGGLVFVLVALMNFVPQTRAGGWAPLWLLTLHGAAVGRELKWFCRHLLVTLMMYLAGDVELIVIGYQFAAVAAAATTVAMIVRGDPSRAARLAAAGALALAAAFFISLLQALPTFELSRLSLRRYGLDYSLRRMFVLPHLSLLALPAMGPIWAAALAGLWARRRSPFFWAVALVLPYSLALAFDFLGMLRLFNGLPIVGGLVAQYRVLIFAFALLTALAAAGLDAVARLARPARWLAAAGVAMIVSQSMLLLLALQLPDQGLLLFYQAGSARLLIFAGLLPLTALGLALAAAPWWAEYRPVLARRLLLAAIPLVGLPVLGAAPRKPLHPPPRDARFREFFAAHPGLYRVQSVYRFNDFPDISVPAQTGFPGGPRAADAWITVTLDRYARLLDAFLPRTVEEQNGRISGYAAHRLLKEGEMSLEALKLYNLLGIRFLAADNLNLKFAGRYSLAFADSALARDPNARTRRDNGVPTLSFAGAVSGRVFVQPGDRLRLKAAGDCPDAWLVATLSSADGPRRLAAARALTSRPVTLSASLPAPAEGLDATLTLAGPGKCGLTLADPVIDNPDKYFRRVEYDAPFNLFENPGALPPAFLAAEAKPARRETAAGIMLSPAWDPARTAVAEGDQLPPPFPLKPGEGARFTITLPLARRPLLLLESKPGSTQNGGTGAPCAGVAARRAAGRRAGEVPGVRAPVPDFSGAAGGVQSAVQRGRAVDGAARVRERAARGSDREEAVFPRPARGAGAELRHAGLRPALRLLPELAELAGAAGSARRCVFPAGERARDRAAGAADGFAVRGEHLQRAADHGGVGGGGVPRGAAARARDGLRLQRERHARGA